MSAAAPKRDAPAADLANKFSGKIAPSQISFNHLSHYRNRGMPVRRGQKAPESMLCSKNPGSNIHRESRTPDGKQL
jgi:hypothetical protein